MWPFRRRKEANQLSGAVATYLKMSDDALSRARATADDAQRVAANAEVAADRGLSELVELMANQKATK